MLKAPMYVTICNPVPHEVSYSPATGSVLIKVGQPGAEIHCRFGSAGDAATFFLDVAKMLAEKFKEADKDAKKTG